MTTNMIEKLPNELLGLRARMLPLKANDKAPETFTAGWKEGIAAKQFTDNQFTGNIGLRTGSYTDGYLVVVDIDVKHGQDGTKSDIYKYCINSDTLTVKTPTNGYHFYFWAPTDTVINNKVGLDTGVDIRGNNGYVVCPPSVLNGKEYMVIGLKSISSLPSELVSILAHKEEKEAYKSIQAPQNLNPKAVENTTLDLVAKLIREEWIEGSRNIKCFQAGCDFKASGTEYNSALNSFKLLLSVKKVICDDFTEAEAIRAFDSGYNNKNVVAGRDTVKITKDQENAELALELYNRVTKDVVKVGGGVMFKVNKNLTLSDISIDKSDIFTEMTKLIVENPKYTSTIRSAAVQLSGCKTLSDDILFARNYIPVNNGNFNILTGKLEERKEVVRDASSYNYLGTDAPEPKLFLRFLNDCVGDESRYLLTALAYSLTAKISDRAFFFVHGPTASGKSTLINMLQKLSGNACIVNRGILSSDNRFGSNALYGRRVVIMHEADTLGKKRKFDSSAVKTLTGNDTIGAERKGAESYSFTPIHKLWLSSNLSPDVLFDQSDSALWNRMHIFKFNKPESRNSEYYDENILAKEGDLILTYLLNFGMSTNFSAFKSQNQKETEMSSRTDGNFMHDFLNGELGMDINGNHTVTLSIKDFKANFIDFCNNNPDKMKISMYNRVKNKAEEYGAVQKVLRVGNSTVRSLVYKIKAEKTED